LPNNVRFGFTLERLLLPESTFMLWEALPLTTMRSVKMPLMLNELNYLYGSEHCSRARQLCRHSIISKHFMEPEGSTAVFTKILHLSLPWAKPIQSTQPQLISSSKLSLGSPPYTYFVYSMSQISCPYSVA
jgi:hypothetical protein